MSEETKELNNPGSGDAKATGDVKSVDSAKAGSPNDLIASAPNPNHVGGGEAELKKEDIDLSKYVTKETYEALEKKLGTQGGELGDLRTFFQGMTPLLEKLDQSPDLVQAIIDGKVDDKTLEALSKGETSVEAVTTVTKAHEDVKKELGKKKYEAMKPEDIEKLVDTKVQKAIKDTKASFEKSLTGIEDNREFENKVNAFIKNTPDFIEYAEAVAKWFNEHPDQFDIEIAYNAVKGIKVVENEKGEAAKKAAEEAKNVAAAAAAGGSQGAQIAKDSEVVDQLIAGSPNPNDF